MHIHTAHPHWGTPDIKDRDLQTVCLRMPLERQDFRNQQPSLQRVNCFSTPCSACLYKGNTASKAQAHWQAGMDKCEIAYTPVALGRACATVAMCALLSLLTGLEHVLQVGCGMVQTPRGR